MKYTIALILSLLLIQNLVSKDKAYHFAAGYVFAHATNSVTVTWTDNKKVIKYGPLIACIALGVGKELVDKYDSDPKSTFEWLDIAYTTGGGITLITIDIKKRRAKALH